MGLLAVASNPQTLKVNEYALAYCCFSIEAGLVNLKIETTRTVNNIEILIDVAAFIATRNNRLDLAGICNLFHTSRGNLALVFCQQVADFHDITLFEVLIAIAVHSGILGRIVPRVARNSE